MNIMLQWLLFGGVLGATACVVVIRRATARRRGRKTCERLRAQAMRVGQTADALATLARSVGRGGSAAAPWQMLADQAFWLTCETSELRQQSRHLGLRTATRYLCDSLVRLEVALHRQRRLRVPDTPSRQQEVVAERYRASIDEFAIASRFLVITACVDECGQGPRCSCGDRADATDRL